MVRVTNSVARKRRKKRLLKQAKGFFGDRKNHIRNAKNVLMISQAPFLRDTISLSKSGFSVSISWV